MHNTLVTESDVTSSMMGEIYRQLASAQLRGKLYKTGYRKARAFPKEVQTGTTSQNAAITTGHGVSAVATGTSAASAPNTSQFRTPSRSVRLVTVLKGPVATQTMTVNTSSSPVQSSKDMKSEKLDCGDSVKEVFIASPVSGDTCKKVRLQDVRALSHCKMTIEKVTAEAMSQCKDMESEKLNCGDELQKTSIGRLSMLTLVKRSNNRMLKL